MLKHSVCKSLMHGFLIVHNLLCVHIISVHFSVDINHIQYSVYSTIHFPVQFPVVCLHYECSSGFLLGHSNVFSSVTSGDRFMSGRCSVLSTMHCGCLLLKLYIQHSSQFFYSKHNYSHEAAELAYSHFRILHCFMCSRWSV